MERNSEAVKRKRRYDSSGRQAQARQSRLAVLDIAERFFLEQGYAPTTIAAIAEAAAVSAETIYKTFGGKPGLVRAIRDRRLTGGGTPSAEQRSNRMRMSEPNPRIIIDNWGKLTAEVAPTIWPILALIRDAAATDPDLGGLLDDLDQERHRRMEVNARHLYESGHIRSDVSLEEATDVLWTYSSPELYELLVLRRKWTPERYGRFVAGSIQAALLPPAE